MLEIVRLLARRCYPLRTVFWSLTWPPGCPWKSRDERLALEAPPVRVAAGFVAGARDGGCSVGVVEVSGGTSTITTSASSSLRSRASGNSTTS